MQHKVEADAPVMEQTGTRTVLGERLSARLFDLAEQVRRLNPPGRIDPERFWRDKSELAGKLAELAHDAGRRLG